MKILVVDDELDICELLQYNLETEGYEVAAVNSAEEALALNLTEYALILLDVMMENMSGFQMAHKMKENPATRTTWSRASISVLMIILSSP